MPKREYPLDRSAAFTALLEHSTVFARMDSRKGTEVVTMFLEDWYESPDLNMFEYARGWTQQWEDDMRTERGSGES